MQINKTPTYIGFYFKYFNLEIKMDFEERNYRKSEKLTCTIITKSNKLNMFHLRQLRDYFDALINDKIVEENRNK